MCSSLCSRARFARALASPASCAAARLARYCAGARFTHALASLAVWYHCQQKQSAGGGEQGREAAVRSIALLQTVHALLTHSLRSLLYRCSLRSLLSCRSLCSRAPLAVLWQLALLAVVRFAHALTAVSILASLAAVMCTLRSPHFSSLRSKLFALLTHSLLCRYSLR